MSCSLSRRIRGVAVSLVLSCSVAFSQTAVEPEVNAPGVQKTTVAASGDESRTPLDKANVLPLDRARIRIGTGDLIEVSIYGVPDFHQTARVNELGSVSLPLIGECKVGGETVEEAQESIAKPLVSGGYFRDPHVTVLIKEYASQGVSMLGEITKPGVYPMVGTRRLYDLVSEAGGFTAKAGKLVTITHRDEPNQAQKINISDDLAKSPESNVEVFPGDTIVVSKAGIVYVVGDVQRPGGFVMENNERMTVLQAIALAQGTTRTAALGAARILRRTPSGPTEVKIPLKQIMAAKSNDMELNPEDILFIPGSAAKGALSRSFEGVFQVATSLAVYGVH